MSLSLFMLDDVFCPAEDFFFNRGQFWPSGIVVACICPPKWSSVYPCVNPVQAGITKSRLEVQNTLVKIPIILALIEYVIQCQIL